MKWNKGSTWVFPLTECSKSNGRLCGLGFINTMLAGSTRPMMDSEQRDIQQSMYLFLLAAASEWQWCLFAAQMSVWRFPHTCIPLTHKTHLLTLNWHTWDDFPSGEQETSRRGEEWECGGRERKNHSSVEVDVCRTLTKYEKLSFDVPVPLWSTTTWTISVFSSAEGPVMHTSLESSKQHNQISLRP